MKKYLKMIGCIFVYILIYYIVLRLSILPVMSLVNSNASFKAWAVSNKTILIIVNDIVGLIVFVPLIALLKKQSLIKRCNFSKINIKASVLIALMGLASGIFTASVFKLPVIVEKFPGIITLLDYLVNSSTLPIFLAFLVIGSIYKEVLYRGLIFNELKENMSLSLAILIQGLIYGLLFFDLNVPLTTYGLLGAVVFALLYIWYDSMWAPIIAQIGSTGGIYVFGKLIELYPNANLILVIVISLILTAAGIYALWAYKDRLGSKAKAETQNRTLNA